MSSATEPTQPPVAEPRPVTTVHHGIERTDPYDWLRDKEDPEVVAYLEAENAWTEERTAHLSGLRERIFEEIKERTQETDLSVPTRSRGFWYYSRSFEGKEYGASCRVPVADEDDWTPPRPDAAGSPDEPAVPGEQLLLDLNELAEGHEFFSLGGSSVSPSTALLAYATDTVGDERYTVRVKDLGTGDLLEDELTGVLGGVTWDRDSAAFYYTTVDDTWRPDKVWRHVLGTPQTDDELLFTEPDGRYWTGIGRSRTDRFLYVVTGSKSTTEVRFLDFDAPEAGLQLFAPRVDGLEYGLEHARLSGRDIFLVLHNADGPDFAVATTPTTPTPQERWAPLVPHDPSVRLEAVEAFAGHLVVHQRSDGLTQLRIVELDESAPNGLGDDYLVGFDDELYTIEGGSNPAFDQPVVRIGYTTLAVPASVYDYDVRTRERRLLRRVPVLGGFDPADYVEERLWATSVDGERVPISLVARREVAEAVAAGTPAPLHLYGYGSYEASMDPYFSVARLSVLDRGAVFAIAHVRGGGEMGRRWYDAGKLEHKQNTFSDFIACGRHLVETGWTTPDRMVAEGGSAGGLLMGAVLNQAPELWGGVVAAVPFVDALTSMLDSSLPLTIGEYEEWGNPEDDPDAYARMAAYAPYDNVAALDYPPILAETSINDTRVLYVEPAKWVARLRAEAVGRRDVLLRTEMAAGHGGVSGRYKSWKDRAFSLAWILDRMGLADAVPAGHVGPREGDS
ncbi:S9 family peptidase [Nocardioides zeae]|uniref:S9 family peptidase n=1 Tax=Nocardioides imazamoxiresistens TaxID=3231893 RepID=A0ABU3Q0K3_9ACTN|nr:S9 family peptidase [Nocardioides zeae]MDT9594567.1 S9 family peptidase [Nocardioides zeae]